MTKRKLKFLSLLDLVKNFYYFDLYFIFQKFSREIFSKLYVLLLSVFYIPKSIMEYIKLKNQIKIEKDTIGLIIDGHMGDIFIQCSLIGAFKKKFKKKVLVVVPKNYQQIPEMFRSIDSIYSTDYDSISITKFRILILRLIMIALKILPHNLKEYLKKFVTVNGGELIFIPLFLLLINEKKLLKNYSKLYRMESHLFGLDFKKENFEKPKPTSKEIYKKVRKKFKELGLKLGKTVIIYPITYSAFLLPKEFWQELADEIKKRGYSVATNVWNNEKPIPGTVPLFTEIKEKIAAAELAGTVIGVRSGIFDVLASADCKKIIIYTGYAGNKKISWFARIKYLEPKGQNIEFFPENLKKEGLEKIKTKILKEL